MEASAPVQKLAACDSDICEGVGRKEDTCGYSSSSSSSLIRCLVNFVGVVAKLNVVYPSSVVINEAYHYSLCVETFLVIEKKEM